MGSDTVDLIKPDLLKPMMLRFVKVIGVPKQDARQGYTDFQTKDVGHYKKKDRTDGQKE